MSRDKHGASADPSDRNKLAGGEKQQWHKAKQWVSACRREEEKKGNKLRENQRWKDEGIMAIIIPFASIWTPSPSTHPTNASLKIQR
jgi:hypothetical protein